MKKNDFLSILHYRNRNLAALNEDFYTEELAGKQLFQFNKINLYSFFIICLLAMSAFAQKYPTSTTKAYALRLEPNQDLKKELQKFVEEKDLSAACIITCVGSLTSVNIRYANQNNFETLKGHFEIVSLVGVLSKNGSHVHISVSDSTGKTIGGHLGDGSNIYTTAEIVLGIMPDYDFTRETDPTFGYKELVIRPRKRIKK